MYQAHDTFGRVMEYAWVPDAPLEADTHHVSGQVMLPVGRSISRPIKVQSQLSDQITFSVALVLLW